MGGLVHVTALHGRLESMRKGQKVEVRVMSVDTVAGRMNLSMKPGPADWSAFEGMDPGKWHRGVVQNFTKFGAFVDVKSPNGGYARGWVHVTESPEKIYKGKGVKVRVMSVDTEAGRLNLSMMPGPVDLSAFEGVSADTWLDGKVADFKNSQYASVIVKAPDGKHVARGWLHSSNIKDGLVQSEKMELQKNRDVRVRMVSLDIDEDTNLTEINLSMRDRLEPQDVGVQNELQVT